MNIIVDCRILSTSYHNGLSRYAAGVTTALSELIPLTVLINDKRQLTHLPKDTPYLLGPALSPHTQRKVTRLLNKAGVDMVYSPTQFFTVGKARFSVITSLHDTTGFDTPRSFSPDVPLHHRVAWDVFHGTKYLQRAILNRADHVVTVSKQAKQSILRHGLTSTPVSVVYNAPFITEAIAYKGGHTLVYIGSFYAYKQVDLLVSALKLLPGYRLVCVSRAAPAVQQMLRKRLIDQSQLEFLDGATDEEIAHLMKRSAALVTASTHEGFGLPIVEAQSMGVPVIISDIPIFHEVCQEGSALFFDPRSPEAFARAVRMLPTKAPQLIAAGHKSAARFSWQKSAKTLLSILIAVHQASQTQHIVDVSASNTSPQEKAH